MRADRAAEILNENRLLREQNAQLHAIVASQQETEKMLTATIARMADRLLGPLSSEPTR